MIVDPTSVPAETSFIYTLPARKFSHIVVFLLPGVTLPSNTAAAIYMAVAPRPNAPVQQENFKFLGGIGQGKESGIFKINNLTGGGDSSNNPGEVDMDAPDTPQISEITLGISIEPAESVAARMPTLAVGNNNNGGGDSSSALVRAGAARPPSQQTTLVIAQRIIKNAFDYLASFGGNEVNGVEVVPLKAFNEWWKKFESRVRTDPTFLERVSD